MNNPSLSEPVTPKPAVSLIPVRDASSGQGLEVLMLFRARDMKAFSGIWAYPGGKIDSEDMDPRFQPLCPSLDQDRATRTISAAEDRPKGINGIHLRERFGPTIKKRLGRSVPPDERPDLEQKGPENRGAWFAAVRELYEETGILFVRDQDGDLVPRQRIERELQTLPERYSALTQERFSAALFYEWLDRQQWQIPGRELRPVGRLVTPKTERYRFDTRFFMCRLPEEVLPESRTGESEKVSWFGVKQALDAAHQAEMALIPPTLLTLTVLSHFRTTRELFETYPSPLS